MSDELELHLYCSICLSLFLPDAPREAEAVATPCGHIYHRDCIEGVIKTQGRPQCGLCARALSDNCDQLLKIFIVFEESDYDAELQQAVRDATHFDDHTPDAIVAEAECREKIDALREEQEYNHTVISALEAQWLAIDKLNDAAEKRVKVLEDQLATYEDKLEKLEEQLGGA